LLSQNAPNPLKLPKDSYSVLFGGLIIGGISMYYLNKGRKKANARRISNIRSMLNIGEKKNNFLVDLCGMLGYSFFENIFFASLFVPFLINCIYYKKEIVPWKRFGTILGIYVFSDVLIDLTSELMIKKTCKWYSESVVKESYKKSKENYLYNEFKNKLNNKDHEEFLLEHERRYSLTLKDFFYKKKRVELEDLFKDIDTRDLYFKEWFNFHVKKLNIFSLYGIIYRITKILINWLLICLCCYFFKIKKESWIGDVLLYFFNFNTNWKKINNAIFSFIHDWYHLPIFLE
jgi:hypothetical protein